MLITEYIFWPFSFKKCFEIIKEMFIHGRIIKRMNLG